MWKTSQIPAVHLCQSCLSLCNPSAPGAFVLLDSSVLQWLGLQGFVTSSQGNGCPGRGERCYSEGKVRGSSHYFCSYQDKVVYAAALTFSLFPAIILVPFFPFSCPWCLVLESPCPMTTFEGQQRLLWFRAGLLGEHCQTKFGLFGEAVDSDGGVCEDQASELLHVLCGGAESLGTPWRSRMQVGCLATNYTATWTLRELRTLHCTASKAHLAHWHNATWPSHCYTNSGVTLHTLGWFTLDCGPEPFWDCFFS